MRFLLVLLCLTSALRAAEPADVVFCSYNLENFNDGTPPGETSKYGGKKKSEEAIATQIRIISEIRPDILGVCEMGSREKFLQFQGLLKALGLDYIASEFVQAADEDRHLALLSRFPIVAHESKTDVRFEVNGHPEQVRRGFLDVTVQVNDSYRLRCVGTHLKSKLPIPDGEALIRRLEAEKLREHLDTILAADPDTNLICYGDFNDTKNEPMFQAVSGVRGTPGYMADLWCRDRLGDRWTHYWKVADQYSRIDYLFVSPALFGEVIKEKSAIYRSDDWNAASDHRPIYTVIRAEDRKRR